MLGVRALRLLCAASLAISAASASASASASFGCTDDVQCSLNGVCGRDGVCRCDPGWGGEQCATLRLAPAATENGYRHLNRSSWGGSVIKQGSTYHMFVEEIVNDCGLNTYARNMRVAHAVSDSAAGPYRSVGLVTNYSASTPHAVRDPSNGDWLIFATGCGRQACLAVSQCANGLTGASADMNPCPDKSSSGGGGDDGGGGSRRHPLAAARPQSQTSTTHASPCTCPKPGFAMPGAECSVDWGTNVWRAAAPDGPWELAASPLMDVDHPKLQHADGTPLVFANPSALLMPNCSATTGTAAVMYRDFLQKLQFPATNVIGLAWSYTGWAGPYLPENIERKIFPDYAEVRLIISPSTMPHARRCVMLLIYLRPCCGVASRILSSGKAQEESGTCLPIHSVKRGQNVMQSVDMLRRWTGITGTTLVEQATLQR